MFYTGVGSRSTPSRIQAEMTYIAEELDKKGYTLRSGGAEGADLAFEAGAGKKEILVAKNASEQALEMAAQIHPAWHKCSPYAKKLHARNCMQVLGKNLDSPSEFVVCWTPNGEKKGGTRTAMALAEERGIPVYNLYFPEHLKEVKEALCAQE